METENKSLEMPKPFFFVKLNDPEFAVCNTTKICPGIPTIFQDWKNDEFGMMDGQKSFDGQFGYDAHTFFLAVLQVAKTMELDPNSIVSKTIPGQYAAAHPDHFNECAILANSHRPRREWIIKDTPRDILQTKWMVEQFGIESPTSRSSPSSSNIVMHITI